MAMCMWRKARELLRPCEAETHHTSLPSHAHASITKHPPHEPPSTYAHAATNVGEHRSKPHPSHVASCRTARPSTRATPVHASPLPVVETPPPPLRSPRLSLSPAGWGTFVRMHALGMDLTSSHIHTSTCQANTSLRPPLATVCVPSPCAPARQPRCTGMLTI